MKISILFYLLLLFVLYFNYSNSQNLYDFNLNTRVNINNHPHFKINYYPNSSDVNYKGDFYPDLESNSIISKYTFLTNFTINSKNDLYSVGVLSPTYQVYGSVANANSVLIIPQGITITINSVSSLSNVIVKGSLVLNPNVNAIYDASKTIIFPNGVFSSKPANSNVNHTIILQSYLSTVGWVQWDPLVSSTFISLGGIVKIKGSNTDSPWIGNNQGFGNLILRSFPVYNGKPIIKLEPAFVDTMFTFPSIQYYYSDRMYVGQSPTGDQYFLDPPYFGLGAIYIHPWSKNVLIKGVGDSSMVFTGDSIVDIQNSIFSDIGHTQNKKIIEYQLDQDFNVVQSGIPANPSDRYPITLLHVTKFVNIQNNAFLSTPPGTSRSSKIPKSFIGVKRSFGNIIGNAFVLKGSAQNTECTGISLFYGTEQFNISYNAFISTYTGDKLNSDYDDNSGIKTSSPYSSYEYNAFEGLFRGGAIQVTPIQNRILVAGLTQDQLLGKYSGLYQDNTMNFKVNNVWNNVVFKESYFSGETEIRYNYPTTCQPPIRVCINGGWSICQRSSIGLPPNNNTNIEFIYDSIYISNTLKINDRPFFLLEAGTHNGSYNAMTLKNSRSTSYLFFTESFQCKYLSISDTIFTHYHNSLDLSTSAITGFLKNYTDQTYFKNINSTKYDVYYGMGYLFPFYQFSPYSNNQPITSNLINISFIPNFDFTFGNGQAIVYAVDNVIQLFIPHLYKSNFTQNSTIYSNIIQFSNTTTNPNGPYDVVVSSLESIPTPTLYTNAGPFFASTYIVDIYAINFYLGISFSPDYNVATPISIFGNQWTICGLIDQNCKTTGLLSKANASSLPYVTFIESLTNEFKMLTSYLCNDNQLSIPSTVNISLPGPYQYKFYIYSYNPTWSGSTIVDSLPYFTIKINGKYQEPFTRTAPSFGKSEKYGPFYWNNQESIEKILQIEWASDNINYQIPLSGIEIYSSLSIPFPIPITL